MSDTVAGQGRAEEAGVADARGWDAAVIDALADPVYAMDANWRMVVFNAAAEAYFGAPRSLVMGRGLWELFPEGIGTAFEIACRRAMDGGEGAVFELPSRMRAERTVELRIALVPGGGVVVLIHDVTERRRIDQTLRASPNQSAEILESISDAFFALDPDFRFTYVNRIAEAWWGRPRDQMIGEICWEVFPQTVGGPNHEAITKAMRERRVVRVEALSPLLHRWVETSVFPAQNGLSVYFRDIQARKDAERRQALLVNELNHRVKNTLAIVQGLVRQTLSTSETPGAAKEALTSRLVALASAHDVITGQDWTGADLAEVIQRGVGAQLDRPDRLHLDGPAFTLAPQVALSLALGFHELTTNALKYGALSVPEGRIDLSWRVGEGRLRMTWRESGGPPVSEPTRRGFGSRLIERGLAIEIGGAVNMRFEPEGLVCEIDGSLERLSAGRGFAHPA